MKNEFRELVHVPLGKIKLEGELVVPSGSVCLVVFSHGSGSSRFSSRNSFVAKELHKQKISTFLFDLLTKEEDEIYSNRFNIDLLTERLVFVTKYLSTLPRLAGFRFGYFGASTGSASAFRAAAALPKLIRAVVSRGGRPDLAMKVADQIEAPTLLIVGELDFEVIELNNEVYEVMKCDRKMEIVSGATHLFEEPGALDSVALLAVDWFNVHLNNRILTD